MTETESHKIIESFKSCCKIIDDGLEEGEIVDDDSINEIGPKIGDAHFAQYLKDELFKVCL